MSFQKGCTPWNKGKTNVYSKETLKKLSDSHKGQRPWMKGKHHTETTKRKISEKLKGNITWLKGRKQSAEHRLNNSLGHKGQNAWNKGIKMSEDFCLKDSMKKKQLYAEGKIIPNSYKGSLRHRNIIQKVANSLKRFYNNIEIEKPVRISYRHWRVLDILADNEVCFEIGQCNKNKIKELEQNGFTVIHLPYCFFD